MASDYTDGLAEKAGELIHKYLLRAYENGNDKEAREKVNNASCIAGMAFTNAFLGCLLYTSSSREEKKS